MGKSSGYRQVRATMARDECKIHLSDTHNKLLRTVEFRQDVHKTTVLMSKDKDLTVLAVRVPDDIDLVSKLISHLCLYKSHSGM